MQFSDMATVKPIQELAVANEGCFAFFAERSQEISITYEHPDGVRQYTDFDAFDHPNGTIVRFPREPEFGFTPWNLFVALSSGNTFLLQWGAYEDNFESWENLPLPPHSFLAFMKSRDIREAEGARVLASHRRCDNQTYGPSVGYFPRDGIKPTSMDLSIIKNYNASLFRPVVSANSVAHITHFNFHSIYMSWRNWPIVSLAARTLAGSLRQTAEWRDLYLSGLSNDSVAADANEFFIRLGITEDMIDELKQTEVMMPVERFMRGHGDARHGFSETGILPSSLKTHLKRQLTYKTLSSLESQHPDRPVISSALKEQELLTQRESILLYIANCMPEVEDMYAVSIDEVYRKLRGIRNQDEPRTADGPIHPLNKSFAEKAIDAARYFYATAQSN